MGLSPFFHPRREKREAPKKRVHFNSAANSSSILWICRANTTSIFACILATHSVALCFFFSVISAATSAAWAATAFLNTLCASTASDLAADAAAAAFSSTICARQQASASCASIDTLSLRDGPVDRLLIVNTSCVLTYRLAGGYGGFHLFRLCRRAEGQKLFFGFLYNVEDSLLLTSLQHVTVAATGL